MSKEQVKTPTSKEPLPLTYGWPQWVDSILSDFISGKSFIKTLLLAGLIFALYGYFFADELRNTTRFFPDFLPQFSQNAPLNYSLTAFIGALIVGVWKYLSKFGSYLKTQAVRLPVIRDIPAPKRKELLIVSTEMFSASGGKKERQINIPGEELYGLRVYFSTESDYWRLGIKLEDQGRFLDFHLYKDQRSGPLSARFIYTNDQGEPIDDRELEITKDLDGISFGYSRSEENYTLLVYRDEEIIRQKVLRDLSSRTTFSTSKIRTWGDGNPYEIVINQTVISGRPIKLSLADQM